LPRQVVALAVKPLGLSFRRALVAQGIEHRFPKPFRGALRTKAKRPKRLLCLRFRLSSSRIISHLLTPLAAQVRPKHGPEILPRLVTRSTPAPKSASRSGIASTPGTGTTDDAEAPTSNADHRLNGRPFVITTQNPGQIAAVNQGKHPEPLSQRRFRMLAGLHCFGPVFNETRPERVLSH
jgi:hypothetical protein